TPGGVEPFGPPCQLVETPGGVEPFGPAGGVEPLKPLGPAW
ncbi:MAG: hypothetical protein QOD82_4058, partial [Pseudonocardiales bacterium]|nr:hypothetical protein [Pseudonocardiales bacterium]